MQGGPANPRVFSAIPYWMSCSGRKGGPGRRSVDGGLADADRRDSCSPESQIAVPATHSDFPVRGAVSQTGRAPFIIGIGNGQVLVGAVCVTATVLANHLLPMLAKCVCIHSFIQSWSRLG